MSSGIGVLLFILACTVVIHKLQQYSFAQIVAGIALVRTDAIILAVVLTFFTYMILTCYDTLSFYFFDHSQPYTRIARAAFTAAALANNTGLSFISNATLRARFHASFGLNAKQIASILAFSVLTQTVGFLLVSSLVFIFFQLDDLQKFLPSFLPLSFIGYGCLCLLLLYVCIAMKAKKEYKVLGLTIPHVRPFIVILQMCIGMFDWFFGSLVLRVLLPADLGMSFLHFFEMYTVAHSVAVLSQVPGGIGVIESLLLYLLPETIPSTTILGALLVYRVIFFFLPLLIAIFFLAHHEIHERHHLAKENSRAVNE